MKRASGKKWGNALGGYKLQNRKGGKFSSGFAGARVSTPTPSMTKGQRRYAEFQAGQRKSQKKARNKRIAKAAVAVAVVGGAAYATNRSYQNTKTARPIDMQSRSLSATRGARGKVRSPGGKVRPLKLETKHKELLTNADGSTTTRALKSLGINNGTPVQFGTNQAFQVKGDKKPSLASKALAGAVVVNTTASQINSAARNAEEAQERAKRARQRQVKNSAFGIKSGKRPGQGEQISDLTTIRKNGGRPVVSKMTVESAPKQRRAEDVWGNSARESTEFAGGDWGEGEMGRHFANLKGHWETGNSGIARDTRKDKNKGKQMRSVTLEASDDAMHPSSRNRTRKSGYSSPLRGDQLALIQQNNAINLSGDILGSERGVNTRSARAQRNRAIRNEIVDSYSQTSNPSSPYGVNPSMGRISARDMQHIQSPSRRNYVNQVHETLNAGEKLTRGQANTYGRIRDDAYRRKYKDKAPVTAETISFWEKKLEKQGLSTYKNNGTLPEKTGFGDAVVIPFGSTQDDLDAHRANARKRR